MIKIKKLNIVRHIDEHELNTWQDKGYSQVTEPAKPAKKTKEDKPVSPAE